MHAWKLFHDLFIRLWAADIETQGIRDQMIYYNNKYCQQRA